jgi:hypothetical protein
LVVFGVAQDMQDKQLLVVVSDVSNQPALVMGDIEHNTSADLIDITPTLLYVWEVFPLGSLDNLVPRRQ